LLFDKEYDGKQSQYNNLMEAANFMQYTNSIQVINSGLVEVKQKEASIKADIKSLLDNSYLTSSSKTMIKNILNYIQKRL